MRGLWKNRTNIYIVLLLALVAFSAVASWYKYINQADFSYLLPDEDASIEEELGE